MARLTTNSQETSLGDLLSSGNSIFLIPFFQREYRWRPEKIKNLQQDILNVVDGSSDKHFLGAIIIHGRRAAPTDPKIYEVIDGQQRLTTLFLFVCALVRMLAENEHAAEAAQIAQNYILHPRDYNRSNLRLHSCRLDRSMMKFVMDDLRNDAELSRELQPYNINPLPSYGKEKGPLRNNYNNFKRFFREEFEQGGIDRVRDIYKAFFDSFTLVQIDVVDPTDGPKIFDSLNSQQEPMKIGDLVRNEIFRKVADEKPEFIERIDEEHWQPFYSSFEVDGQNMFDKYFFPYGLVHNPNLKKSDVFISLREKWSEEADPANIIQELDRFRRPFLDASLGTNFCKFDSDLQAGFQRLFALNAPSSILPYVMQIGHAALSEEINPKAAVQVLHCLESFLVRRAICGYEPTGLHAVFKRLWTDCDSRHTSEQVTNAISTHRTVTWPGDVEFDEAIKTRPLYGARITPYVLLEFDRSRPGADAIESIDSIEHVLPQSVPAEWADEYGEDNVEADMHALPNLLPCSSSMNSAVGNNTYDSKRERFSRDSKYRSAREFADQHTEWTHDEFLKRGELLSAWALKRWPHKRSA